MGESPGGENQRESQEWVVNAWKVTLEVLIMEHRGIVRGRYNGWPPTRVRPLELLIIEGGRPVRSKPRQYPPKKGQFLRSYVVQLQHLGLKKTCGMHRVGVSPPYRTKETSINVPHDSRLSTDQFIGIRGCTDVTPTQLYSRVCGRCYHLY